jgi:hypothetical protein
MKAARTKNWAILTGLLLSFSFPPKEVCRVAINFRHCPTLAGVEKSQAQSKRVEKNTTSLQQKVYTRYRHKNKMKQQQQSFGLSACRGVVQGRSRGLTSLKYSLPKDHFGREILGDYGL